MVLTLKVISCAMNYNDGLLKEDGLREAQKKNRLLKLPSLIEYFGYCLCCGSHFAGPVYEIKDYLEWTERKGVGLMLSHTVSVLYMLLNLFFLSQKYIIFGRFGPNQRKGHHHHLMGQRFELLSKLPFAWACMCI